MSQTADGRECKPSVPELLTSARQGSNPALGELLTAYWQYLTDLASATLPENLRRKVGASDLVMETFAKAQQNFATFDGQTEGQWRGWLREILENKVTDMIRCFRAAKRDVLREQCLDTGPVGLFDTPARDPSPSSEVAQNEQDRALEQALGRLPEHYRVVIRFRNYEGLSFEEIGRRTDRTADAARHLWSRAVEHLQELLEQSDDTP